jgi:hypothetical protein
MNTTCPWKRVGRRLRREMNSDISSISLKITMAAYGGSICDYKKIGIITMAHKNDFQCPHGARIPEKFRTFPEYPTFKITME